MGLTPHGHNPVTFRHDIAAGGKWDVGKSIEQRLEGLVEGFFTKVFRSGLQPIEVGRRILREMAENKTVSVNRVYAPNEFRVLMGAEDHASLPRRWRRD